MRPTSFRQLKCIILDQQLTIGIGIDFIIRTPIGCIGHLYYVAVFHATTWSLTLCISGFERFVLSISYILAGIDCVDISRASPPCSSVLLFKRESMPLTNYQKFFDFHLLCHRIISILLHLVPCFGLILSQNTQGLMKMCPESESYQEFFIPCLVYLPLPSPTFTLLHPPSLAHFAAILSSQISHTLRMFKFKTTRCSQKATVLTLRKNKLRTRSLLSRPFTYLHYLISQPNWYDLESNDSHTARRSSS